MKRNMRIKGTSKKTPNRKRRSADNVSDVDSKQFIKELWQKHTEVQEQILRLHSAPIPIVPDSPRFASGKLFLTADSSNNTDSVIQDIEQALQSKKSETEDYILSSFDVDNEELIRLSNLAANNNIEFSQKPIIDGVVKKTLSVHSLLSKCQFAQIHKTKVRVKVAELDAFNKYVTEQNVVLPCTASIILRINPSPSYFLKSIFPEINLGTKIILNEKSEEIRLFEYIVTNGCYIDTPVLQELQSKIGLNLNKYDIIFTISQECVAVYENIEEKWSLPFDRDTNSFCFTTSTTQEKGKIFHDYNEVIFDFDVKYTRLSKFMNKTFGKENVKFNCHFYYCFDRRKFDTEFMQSLKFDEQDYWNKIYACYQTTESIRISPKKNCIGIDINWKQPLRSVLHDITSFVNKCPYIIPSWFPDQNCNITLEFKDESFDQVEKDIRDKFPSIQIERNDTIGSLYFYQEYETEEQKNRRFKSLQEELNDLDFQTFQAQISPLTSERKYRLKINQQAIEESQEELIKALRSKVFQVDDKDIGKLIRIKYPKLVFDLSEAYDEKAVIQLFDSHTIGKIKPNLTGDLEKISRLKNSFKNIVRGTNLANANLKEFIFDASKATIIEDVGTYTDTISDTYQDINDNLLNNLVNESQKQAIIKTLLAKDLALIQGPPGTGKSTAIAEIIWQHIRKDPDERILLTSETNLAVDNAIDRVVNNCHNIVKPIRIGDSEKLESEGQQFSLELMKKWVKTGTLVDKNTEEDIDEDDEQNEEKLILENWLDNIRRRVDRIALGEDIDVLWNKILSEPDEQLRQIVCDKYVANCNVIGATCSSIGERNTKGRNTKFYQTYCEVFGGKGKQVTNKEGVSFTRYPQKKIQFSTVIQDESSKATPAELSLPLIYGKKNIIIGDHRQLPPLLDKEEFLTSLNVLQNQTSGEKECERIKELQQFVTRHFNELEISHFQRLFEQIDNSLKGVFNVQYRMHPDINEVIKQFYVTDGGLNCGLSPESVDDRDLNNPQSRYHGIDIEGYISPENHVVWLDTDSPELLDGTSRVNYGEVEVIRNLLQKLNESNSFKQFQSHWQNPDDQQIGLISFYGKQIKQLQNVRREFRDIPIRVSTVDRFQGMERNIIIVSMVRSNCIAIDKNQKADFERFPELGFAQQTDLGFAQSPNRLNVALSRAKRLLIIVGNSQLFRQKSIYDNVYKCIKNNPKGRIVKINTK